MKPSVTKPWLKYFPKETLNEPAPKCTIYAYLKSRCAEDPDLNAFYYYGTRVKCSGFVKKIDEVANAYSALGVKKGENVSFLSVSIPETVYSLYAINKLGAISNFIDPRMDTGRILDAIESVGTNVLVVLDIAWPKVKAILPKLHVKHIIVQSATDSLPLVAKAVMTVKTKKPKIEYGDTVRKWSNFMKLASMVEAKEVPYEAGSGALITYTGGTTGSPKGCILTNDGLNAVAHAFTVCGVDYEKGQRLLDIMPVFASYGVVCGLHMSFIMGLEVVLVPKFTPEELGALIKKYHISHMFGVPSFYEKIMHSKALWDVDLSYLLTTGCGGDTMNAGLANRFNNFLREHGGKYPLSQGYGMSEVSGAASACFSNIYKDNSSGIPLPHIVISAFDPDTLEELDIGQNGEICISGDTLMGGYYNNPEETDNVIRTHPDGTRWVHSGDLGYMDEDGFIFINGRIKHMIVRFDGHKVFPTQIMSIVGAYKPVATCAVVGVRDNEHEQGELPIVVVELKDNLPPDTDKEAIREELLRLCHEQCEERGRPSDVVIIDKMPLTSMGKNDYLKLAEIYRDHLIKK